MASLKNILKQAQEVAALIARDKAKAPPSETFEGEGHEFVVTPPGSPSVLQNTTAGGDPTLSKAPLPSKLRAAHHDVTNAEDFRNLLNEAKFTEVAEVINLQKQMKEAQGVKKALLRDRLRDLTKRTVEDLLKGRRETLEAGADVTQARSRLGVEQKLSDLRKASASASKQKP